MRATGLPAATLLSVQEPTLPAAPPRGFALFALGFRPFYLLAAINAALGVPIWVAQFLGLLPGISAMPPLAWHAHEMLFGTLAAVIAGFLLTAVRVWTGRPTPTGAPLAALVLLWLIGRVAAWSGPAWLAAASAVAFPLAVAAPLAVAVIAARNWRNLGVIGLLFGLAVACACFHLSLADIGPHDTARLAVLALDLVVLLVTLIGGRVIPFFTRNAVPGAPVRVRPWLDWSAFGATALVVLGDAAGLAGWPPTVLMTVAAALHLARLAGWAPLHTRGKPILWILHLSYAWIAAGFLLRAWADPPLVGVHALAVGAVGGMVVGMMTRTARGHTGYPLRAGTSELAMYLLVQVAVVLRVFGPMALPAATPLLLGLSAAAWAGAFALFALRYAPMLLRPRLDGKPG